jgi:hypothetical protein
MNKLIFMILCDLVQFAERDVTDDALKALRASLVRATLPRPGVRLALRKGNGQVLPDHKKPHPAAFAAATATATPGTVASRFQASRSQLCAYGNSPALASPIAMITTLSDGNAYASSCPSCCRSHATVDANSVCRMGQKAGLVQNWSNSPIVYLAEGTHPHQLDRPGFNESDSGRRCFGRAAAACCALAPRGERDCERDYAWTRTRGITV